ncbi:M14 family metallopeptidase [Alkalihalobacillus sp. AL-G]|uniref:M14 family metallopeptidase n=1 Tax=Alkalihalobacillus sp. AL-G TaxID=2926399 RepID=UPI002729F9AD|nr:M14 family metallopeptidase [Alkalihalobacillus sp. AL-G]WLD92522.1 M14 family metallopeptidase [Alkalihalobacillus sp. AL-G]
MGMMKRFTTIMFVILSTLLIATPFWNSNVTSATESTTFKFQEKAALVSIHVPNQLELDKLVASGIDLTEHVHRNEDGSLEVDAIVTPSELQKLRIKGIEFETVYTKAEAEQRIAQRQEKVENLTQVTAEEDTLKVLRSNFFENYSGTFLYLEVKTSAGESKGVTLTASWNSSQEEATLQRLDDMGEYLYHKLLIPIDKVPDQILIESSLGGSATANVTKWIDEEKPDHRNKHYVQDFIDHYMDPTEVTNRIEQLAKEYPELAEIVELPNQTNGYRRKAQAVLGDEPNSMVVVTSSEWGHEGGNDITVSLTNPAEDNAALSVEVEEQAITVSLATNDNGEISSSAADVVGVLNDEASNLVSAATFREYAGDGVVSATSSQLDNNLSAPDSISRDPYTVKAIRIGKHRDGSKVGVLAYSQEHAREWVTPLVSIETAERLLRNYATDSKTRKLVNNLDIFIVPTVNPDGAHYSMYDYNWQRKNMTNHCVETPYTDPYARNYWGVDLNRNHTVGSVYDGNIGASTNCTSAVFAGPEELSEPEAQNLIWLAEQNPNIQFGMNIHSYGGYFMWPPGSYDENRVPLPRPTAGEEAYFWQASNTILDEIKKYRGTVILPSRTGPIPDVLYSAAGNSADALWYDYGIYAWDFEVGADIWNEEENDWERVGFQPPFEEGHAEAMEFANGMTGLFEVAYQFAKDKKPPRSSITPEKGNYENSVEISFKSSEPATIFYTLDGSKPTFESNKVQINGTREGAETFAFEENTTVNWFAMDAAGNVEKNYDPSGNATNYNSASFKIQ